MLLARELGLVGGTVVAIDGSFFHGDASKASKLIVASEVVNDSSDVNQLHVMAKAAKETLDAEALQVLADEGYSQSIGALLD